jgi:dihydrofolate reductase
MRKLIVSEFVTLDGVMEAPGGEASHPHSGWALDHMGPEQMQYKLDEVLAAESLLLGRITYEGFSAAWPSREGEFADKMNSMPKHVVSTTLRDPAWNDTTVLQGGVATSVATLKAGDGGPILVAGSRTLVHGLLLAGLVDELRLMVFPVAVGQGLRVFPDDRVKLSWRLASQQSFATGVLALAYEPVG